MTKKNYVFPMMDYFIDAVFYILMFINTLDKIFYIRAVIFSINIEKLPFVDQSH